jgi:hypothetical protein
LTCFVRADKGVGDESGASPARRTVRASALSHILILLAVAAFVFRKPLGRLLARQFPDRAKRQRILGTIIAGFLLVIAIRLAALLW